MQLSKLNWQSLARQVAQLVRFCAVGLTCYLASVAMFTALCGLAHVPYLQAFVLTFLMGNVLGFWLNGRFTYTVNRTFDRTALVRYVTINVGLLAWSFFYMRLLVESLGVWYVGAHVIVGATNAPLSFLVHRAISYRVTEG